MAGNKSLFGLVMVNFCENCEQEEKKSIDVYTRKRFALLLGSPEDGAPLSDQCCRRQLRWSDTGGRSSDSFSQKRQCQVFDFDRIFHGPSAEEEVYEELCAGISTAVWSGQSVALVTCSVGLLLAELDLVAWLIAQGSEPMQPTGHEQSWSGVDLQVFEVGDSCVQDLLVPESQAMPPSQVFPLQQETKTFAAQRTSSKRAFSGEEAWEIVQQGLGRITGTRGFITINLRVVKEAEDSQAAGATNHGNNGCQEQCQYHGQLVVVVALALDEGKKKSAEDGDQPCTRKGPLFHLIQGLRLSPGVESLSAAASCIASLRAFLPGINPEQNIHGPSFYVLLCSHDGGHDQLVKAQVFEDALKVKSLLQAESDILDQQNIEVNESDKENFKGTSATPKIIKKCQECVILGADVVALREDTLHWKSEYQKAQLEILELKETLNMLLADGESRLLAAQLAKVVEGTESEESNLRQESKSDQPFMSSKKDIPCIPEEAPVSKEEMALCLKAPTQPSVPHREVLSEFSSSEVCKHSITSRRKSRGSRRISFGSDAKNMNRLRELSRRWRSNSSDKAPCPYSLDPGNGMKVKHSNSEVFERTSTASDKINQQETGWTLTVEKGWAVSATDRNKQNGCCFDFRDLQKGENSPKPFGLKIPDDW